MEKVPRRRRKIRKAHSEALQKKEYSCKECSPLPSPELLAAAIIARGEGQVYIFSRSGPK
jgi:hypothetical protein